MGTRNLTCVIKDNQFRVAQYGQWDGYPEGAGKHILTLLSNPANVERLRNRVESTSFVSQEEWNRRLETAGIGQAIRMGSEEETRFVNDFHAINRDTGCNILDVIIESDQPIELMDNREFAHDSLFCEWAWVIDFDRNVFEAYRGFNKDPKANSGVFANVPNSEKPNEYAPVALVATFPLNNLPTLDEMIKACKSQEDEDE